MSKFTVKLLLMALSMGVFFYTKDMPTQKKIEIVKDLTDMLQQAKSIIFTDYSKLTHKQLEDLRKKLKKAEGRFIVVKNNLLKRAFQNLNRKLDESQTAGATGILLALADEVGPIKELVNFFKTAAAGIVKSGFFGGVLLSESEINKLANLPSRQQLYANLVSQLQSPLYGLHNALCWNMRKLVWALEAVKTKKA